MSKQDFFPLVAFANDKAPHKAANLQPGVSGIAMANESSFNAGTYQEGLTAYVQGWSDTTPLKELVDYIAPPVPTARRFEFKNLLNAEAFLVEQDDERAIGSGFKRVQYHGETQYGKTKNRGLTYRKDMDDDTLSEEQIVKLLTTRIYRGKLQRAITVLLALATNTAKVWDSTAQPDQDQRAAIAAAQLESGVFPNRGIIGLAAWNLRAAAYAPQENAGATAAYSLTPQQCGQMLGLQDMKACESLYQFSGTQKKRILESMAVYFYAQDVISKDDPSHVKQFVSDGDGLKVHKTEEGVKFVDITVEHYEDIVGTADVGATKLTITAS